MTELFEPTGEHDWRLAVRTADRGGLLADLNAAGLLASTDVHVAERVADLAGEPDEQVRLALALAVRAVRRGSVCLDLDAAVATLSATTTDVVVPDPLAWREAILASPLVAQGALRWEHDRLYLERYHRLEQQVCDDLLARAEQPPPVVDETRLARAVELVRGEHLSAEQEAAAVAAVHRWTTVLTGGPGTGKTTTVARMLVLLADQAHAAGTRISVALAAPTGKAATRLQEAVAAELDALAAESPAAAEAVDRVPAPDPLTLHRLLGWRPDNATRFRHDRGNRLKYDVVVVDESSMVELTMMGRVLESVRPETRLVLVGDPEQLTSVGAGAVLSDLVDGFEGAPASPVSALTRNFRSEQDIKALASALRGGDPDEVLDVLRAPSTQVLWVDTDDQAGAEAALREPCVATASAVLGHALDGDAGAALAALDDHRLLCAHREGPWGVRRWNALVERWLAEVPGVDAIALLSPWYVGRPLLVTSNDYALDVYNGETGVVALSRGEEVRTRAFVSGSRGVRDFAPGRLDAVETMHAMTIHKSQGSQAREVSVLLPDATSRLLTRELFYTAVTRAQEVVRVVGSEAAVRAAVLTEADRATGLARRLRAPSSR